LALGPIAYIPGFVKLVQAFKCWEGWRDIFTDRQPGKENEEEIRLKLD
jgi:hypothetical protein